MWSHSARDGATSIGKQPGCRYCCTGRRSKQEAMHEPHEKWREPGRCNGHAKVTGRRAFVCPVCPSPTDEQKEAAKKVYYSEKMRYNRAKRKKG